jgi:hypothetical protein
MMIYECNTSYVMVNNNKSTSLKGFLIFKKKSMTIINILCRCEGLHGCMGCVGVGACLFPCLLPGNVNKPGDKLKRNNDLTLLVSISPVSNCPVSNCAHGYFPFGTFLLSWITPFCLFQYLSLRSISPACIESFSLVHVYQVNMQFISLWTIEKTYRSKYMFF